MALGKPHYTTALAAARLTVLLPLLLWGVMSAGAYGAVWALTGAMALRVILNFLVLSKLLGLKIRKLLASLWRISLAAAAMVLLLLWVQGSWPGAEAFLPSLARLLALITLGAASYVGCYLLLRLIPGERPEFDLLVEARLKKFLPHVPGFRGNRPPV